MRWMRMERWCWGRGACVAVLGVAAAVLPCVAAAQDWPMWQHDPYRTGFSDIDFDPTAMTHAWDLPSGYWQPIVVEDRLFTLFGQSAVAAYSLATGDLLWENEITGIGGVSGLAYGGGSLWYTTRQGAHLVDPATGGQQDLVPLQWWAETSPAPLVVEHDDGSVSMYTSGNDVVHIRRDPVVDGVYDAYQAWEVAPEFNPSPGNWIGGDKVINLAGDSLIINQPGQFYAVDAQTGAGNRFHSGGVTGGGDPPSVYDESRQVLYVAGHAGSSDFPLNAYSYGGTDDIELVWSLDGPYTKIAIDGDGFIYALRGHAVDRIDPDTHQVVDTATGVFATRMAPTIIGDVMIAFSDRNVGGVPHETYFYDINTMELIHSIAGTNSSTRESIGFVANGYFVQDHRDGIAVFQLADGLAGDINGDGFVGVEDLDVLLANWGDTVAGQSSGDLSGDGVVGQADLDILLGTWGGGTPPGSTIPEPGSLVVLVIGGGLLFRRRRARG